MTRLGGTSGAVVFLITGPTMHFSREVAEPIRRMLAKLKGQGPAALLARGAGSSLSLIVTGTGLAFLIQVLLTRTMGPAEYGPYIYVLSWINVLAVIGRFGFDVALTRFVASYRAHEEWGKLKGIVVFSARFVFTLSIGIGLATLGVLSMFGDKLEPGLEPLFHLGLLSLPCITLLMLAQARLRALKRVALSQLPMQIIRPLIVAIGVGITLAWKHPPLTRGQAMLIHVGTSVLVLFIAEAFWRSSRPSALSRADAVFERREWLEVTAPMVLMAGTWLLMNQVDTLMVGALLGSVEAGLYSVASRIATLISFGLFAVNSIAAPMVSERYATNDRKGLQRVLTLAATGIALWTLPATAGIITLGSRLLLVFGREFQSAYPILVALSFGQLVNALAGSVGLVMNMTGHQKIALKVALVNMVLNITLNLLLIPRLGALGAAIATAITFSVWNAMLAVIVWRLLGVNTTLLPLRKKDGG